MWKSKRELHVNQISTIYAFRHLWSTLSHSTQGENYVTQGLVNLNIIMTWTWTGLHTTPEQDISVTLLSTHNTETIRDIGRALGGWVGGGGNLKLQITTETLMENLCDNSLPFWRRYRETQDTKRLRNWRLRTPTMKLAPDSRVSSREDWLVKWGTKMTHTRPMATPNDRPNTDDALRVNWDKQSEKISSTSHTDTPKLCFWYK